MRRLHDHCRGGFRVLPVLCAVIVLCSAPAAAATLFGTIGLVEEDGRFIPGQMIRLYLVTEAVHVDYTDDPSLNRYQRFNRVNSAHIDFFKQYREKASRPGYLQADAESSIAGTFTFRDIPPGRYFVLVTFPSMIAGCKVAWQVPVDIPTDAPFWVRLTPDNLLLPALTR